MDVGGADGQSAIVNWTSTIKLLIDPFANIQT